MSIVACKILGNGKYQLASDSITVRGWTQTKGNTKTSKLFEANGMDIGYVGLSQEGQLFRIYSFTNRPASANERDILEFLSNFSDWKNKKTDNGEIENSYMIGLNGKVFAIEKWLIEEILTFEAIGAGEDFALAAMHLGHTAKEAVETAIELSIYCEAPVKVIER